MVNVCKSAEPTLLYAVENSNSTERKIQIMFTEGSQIRPNDFINVTWSFKLHERSARDSRQRAISGPSVTRPWILWRSCDARKLAPAGPEALRGKPIYRRPNKNTNNDGGARSASFGLRKRLEIVREGDEKVLEEKKEDKKKSETEERERERDGWKQRTWSGATHAKGGKKLSIKRRERPRRLSGTKTSPSAVRSSNTLLSFFSFLLPPQDRTDYRRLSVWVWTA